MSWKCVLFGLALVLPGTLLSVEGRNTAQSRDDQDEQYLARLLSYFNQDRMLTENGARAAGPDKKSGNQKEAHHHSEGTISSGTGPPPGQQEFKVVPEGNEAGQGLQLARASAIRHEPGQHSAASSTLLTGNIAFIMVVAGCTVLAAVGIIGAGVCWYKYNRGVKAASDVEYPAYGVTGPTKDRLPSPGDRKLAQSAQMYHYQHQKQQMIAMEKANGDMKHDASDDESEEDNVEGDYTVYECPGLAPTGEMEVKNPLFRGDETPSTPANGDSHEPSGDQ